MTILKELKTIQKQLDTIPSDHIPKQHSWAWSRSMNRLSQLIAAGERWEHEHVQRRLNNGFSPETKGPDIR